MIRLLLLSCIVLTGCESVRQDMLTASYDTNTGVMEWRETHVRARLTGDASAKLEKLRISNGKTHSIGVTGAQAQADLDNVRGMADDLSKVAAQSLLKAFIPGL